MTSQSQFNAEVFEDPEALARHVADWLLGLALAKEGPFHIVLSGGSTPRRLYEMLAERPYLDAFPWTRAHWFWGDERFVPSIDPASNYQMAYKAMLSRAPIPKENIHPILTENITPEEAATLYEAKILSIYGADRSTNTPLFDVILLGLGEDGHTASLFPGTSALEIRDRLVVPVTKSPSETRITLTYPALNSSHHVAFLVTGKNKQSVFKRVRQGDQSLPATRLRASGEIIWFVDEAAAKRDS